MIAKVVHIGTPEAHAFKKLAAGDPALTLYATNGRAQAMSHLADAEGIIAQHFQFDELTLKSAKRCSARRLSRNAIASRRTSLARRADHHHADAGWNERHIFGSGISDRA